MGGIMLTACDGLYQLTADGVDRGRNNYFVFYILYAIISRCFFGGVSVVALIRLFGLILTIWKVRLMLIILLKKKRGILIKD